MYEYPENLLHLLKNHQSLDEEVKNRDIILSKSRLRFFLRYHSKNILYATKTSSN